MRPSPMKKLLIVASFCALPLFLAAVPGPRQDQATTQPAVSQRAKEEKVRYLLKVTGAAKMGDQMMAMMVKQYERMPQLPDGFLAKFKELAKPKELLELLVPVYAKNMDVKDIDAITRFFESDSGRRWIAAQPKIMQESQAIGIKWGRELAQKALAAVKK